MCATSLKCRPRCLPRPKSGGWRAWVAVRAAAFPHSCSVDTGCGSRTGIRIPHQTPSPRFSENSIKFNKLLFSVPDPDPNAHVFGPPGSGPFYHQAKIVKKTLIPTVLQLLLDFLSLKNDVNVPSKSMYSNGQNEQKNFFLN
jgi:hypothetical protein